MCGKDIDYVMEFKRRYHYAFDDYIVQVSGNLRTVAMAEATAETIISYDTQAMPGLLQTPEYADGYYRLGGMVTAERIPALVQFRTERQTVLRRHDRPTCLFFVHEHALQLQVGSPKIMEEQYARLLFNTHTLRLVPAGAPIAASSCMLWEFEKARPVVYSETNLAKVFVQDLGAIARTRLLFDRLDEVALSAEQSRSRLAEYVGRPREELDHAGPHLA